MNALSEKPLEVSLGSSYIATEITSPSVIPPITYTAPQSFSTTSARNELEAMSRPVAVPGYFMNNASSHIIQPLSHLYPEAAKLHEALEKHTREIEEKAERIRAPIQKSSPKGRKPTQISNPLYGAQVLREYPRWADDILQGIARLDWYRTTGRSIPLSMRKLIKLLIHLPVLSTQSISSLLLLEERQARRYLEALKLAIPFLIKSMPADLKHIEEVTDDEEWIEHTWIDSYAQAAKL